MHKLDPIDIRGGKLTYGQRIEAEKILADAAKNDGRKFVEVLECLYPGHEVTFTTEWFRLYRAAVEGIDFWVQKERTMLDYQPTADELAAGIRELGKRLGPMSTVSTLAEKFGRDPDEILQWEYGKVFGLLYTDLENAKFRRRHDRMLENKARMQRLSRKR